MKALKEDKMMNDKIVVFGTGKYWENRKKYILNTCEIVCFLDNNPDKWNSRIYRKVIVQPDNITDYEFDYILIMCKAEKEIRAQLEAIGVAQEKIITYKQYRQICIKEYYIRYGELEATNYDVIVISTALNYNGGTMAVIYAVKALKSRGRRVLLCAEDCDDKMLDELLTDKIDVMVAPGLPYNINNTLKKIINNCEAVLVNVFQMLPVACQLNGVKPVLWWIHEPIDLYDPVLNEYPQYVDSELVDHVNCIAVSKIARNNFNSKFPKKIEKTLAYGIPDLAYLKKYYNDTRKKRTFAIIGSVINRKAQDIFIEAIRLLTKEELSSSRFYIIGGFGKDKFSESILQCVKEYNNIVITGNLTREEMDKIYSEIDVVVCPSREETMSIVLTESMMYGKPCISSDSTGMADYIINGVNGFVCRTEDADDLCEKMRYFIHNPEDINRMGSEGRKTYETYFTMDKFADRLCDMMKETIDLFNQKQLI